MFFDFCSRIASRCLFLTRNEPARVRCVYAFAFDGSIEGDVERITPEEAFGAIASKCALRKPVCSPSGYSPRSVARSADCCVALVLMVLKTCSFSSFACSVSHAIPCFCNKE